MNLFRECKERRNKLMSLIKGKVLIRSNQIQYATQNVFYPFQQNTNFFYFTGLNEPNSACIITKDYMHLYLDTKSKSESKWSGKGVTLQEACDLYGADEAFHISELDTFGTITDIGHVSDTLRLIKSPFEQEIMSEAGRISAQSFLQVSKQKYHHEHDLRADLLHFFLRNGGKKQAYEPVVAGDENSLILHYTECNNKIKNHVLIDAGCQYQNYASDISRTFLYDVTDAQKALYNAVLNVQNACLDFVSIYCSLNEIHEFSVRKMQKELKKINLDLSLLEVNNLYFHHVGHYIGLDVHDTPSISRSIKLQEGMVITIEPGIYIPNQQKYREFRNFGIRIEDTVLVSEKPKVLTLAPK